MVKNIILEAHDDGYFSLLILMFQVSVQTDAETIDLKHTSTMAKIPLFIWSSLLIRSTCSCADKFIAVVKMNLIGHILAALMY